MVIQFLITLVNFCREILLLFVKLLKLNWQFILFLIKFMTGFYLINIFYRFGLSYYSYKRRQAERRRAFIEARNMYYRTHPRFNNDDDNHGNDDNHHL